MRIRRGRRAGVTLIEMLIAVAIIGLLAGISFPAVSSGVDSLRLTTAGNAATAFLNTALSRAERREEAVEIAIFANERRISARSAITAFDRTLVLPEGVEIKAVRPELPQPGDAPRRFMLFPGGALPRIEIEIANNRGSRRLVSVDPVTGMPKIERVVAR